MMQNAASNFGQQQLNHASASNSLSQYSTSMAAGQPAQNGGLMLDAGAIMARLSSICDRVCRLNDRLNGYRPSPCETEATKPLEPDTMRRLIDRSMALAMEIEVELNVIEVKI